MAQRRFGPTRGAGVVVIEREGEASITPSALGVTAYTGIFKKGPVGKAFRAKTRTDFLFKAGGVIPESLAPDAALSFYRASNGAGEIWVNRVTDGSEKIAELSMFNRLGKGTLVAKFKAGNAGRWAGKKKKLVDEYASFDATTMTLSNVPANLKQDELAGAVVKFKAVPGKSFVVESNDELGVLQFASDVNLIDELDGTTNELVEIDLSNNGESLAVLVKDGLLKPSQEFGLEFYSIEGNVAELVKSYNDLSLDPAASNYYVDIINADSDSDFLIKVEDLNIGGSLVSGQRPANFASTIKTLTATVLTADIHFLSVSSVANAKAKLDPVVLGSEIIKDKMVLTNTAQGARSTETLTFVGQPSDSETVTIGGDVYTFKTVPVGALDVLIGANLEASIDNLVAKVNEQVGKLYFAEKASATTMAVYAKTAGVAGDSIAVSTTVTGASFGGANLTGGVNQTWNMTSEKMPFLGTTVITSGVAYAPANDFGYGFTLVDESLSSAKEFDVGDTITIDVQPLEVGQLVGGFVFPDESNSRKKFEIVSNDAKSITVKSGSDMTVVATAGGIFRAQYVQELQGGYDGISDITDSHYEAAYDTSTSPLKALRGKNLGLVKLATPGITSSAIQKAGAAFAESQNWQYRYEIPANITDEQAVEEYINATIGRNDFAVTSFPSYYKKSKEGGGLKLVSAIGGIHGVEARIARDYDGYHKAGAGTDARITEALALPDGFENKPPLDEEFLNPQGINVLKFKDGNLILWGDRTVGIDPSFKFKHHREQMSHYENTFLENFDFIIFALNSENSGTQERLKAAFVAYFTPELAKGAIVGKDVQEATLLKIDSENNTDLTRAAGDLFADMSLKLVDTVERFIIRIGKQGVTEDVA